MATPRPIDQVLLAEFLALRTIVLNLQFAVARASRHRRGMKRLIERADDEKAPAGVPAAHGGGVEALMRQTWGRVETAGRGRIRDPSAPLAARGRRARSAVQPWQTWQVASRLGHPRQRRYLSGVRPERAHAGRRRSRPLATIGSSHVVERTGSRLALDDDLQDAARLAAKPDWP